VEHLLMTYCTDPGLIHDIVAQCTTVWISMLEELLEGTDIDFIYIHEDLCYKNGPMISPAMFREFMTPYYRKLTGFLQGAGLMFGAWTPTGIVGFLSPSSSTPASPASIHLRFRRDERRGSAEEVSAVANFRRHG